MNLDLRDRNTQIGLGLVALGVLALFANLGLFEGVGRLVGLLMFGAAGLVVLRAYAHPPTDAWAYPVGLGLLGLGLASLDRPWGGAVFLAAIGVGFLMVFRRNEHRWWAIIPGGVLLTLALTAAYDEWLFPGGGAEGTVFFLGLAATFAALYLLPQVDQSWAIWPALGLGVVGVLTFSFQGGWLLPVILIAIGAWLLSQQARPAEVNGQAPPSPGASGPAPEPEAPPDAEAEREAGAPREEGEDTRRDDETPGT